MKFLLLQEPWRQIDRANDKDYGKMKHINTQKDMRPFAKRKAYSSATTKELQALKNELRQIAGSAASGIYKRTPAD